MRSLIAISAITVLCVCSAAADEPKYKANVPRNITPPDRIPTRYAGELKFVDGFPTDDTVTKGYDYLDTARTAEMSLNATPAT